MDEIQLDDLNAKMEEGLLFTENEKEEENLKDKKLYCVMGTSLLGLVLFLFLWLSESQFSEGVLRTRNEGEECGERLFNDLTCSQGLKCHDGKCHLPSTQIRIIYSNKTLPPPPPPKCPSVNPKVVTYFDYDEHPNRWLDPGPHGFYKNIYSIPYNGCKEVCSSQGICKALSYHGPANQCHLMKQYHFPAPVNNTWNYAIKIN